MKDWPMPDSSRARTSIQYQNAQADTSTTALIASTFAESCDMICAIATPAAAAAFNAAEGKIPVIYTAVSDPVTAQLAGADGTNPGAITGTSDQLPVEAQLKLIRAMQPDATKIGILHTTSETNSDSTLATYKELAPQYGFEIIDQGISTGADLPMALDSLPPGRLHHQPDRQHRCQLPGRFVEKVKGSRQARVRQ